MSKSQIDRQPSCNDTSEPQVLSVDAARKKIFAQMITLKQSEKLPLRDALNRYLSGDIVSAINVPNHNNSAMDGYAIDGSDIPASGVKQFKVIGTAFAGKIFKEKCLSTQCVRIMTGAAMPSGTDTVIMQEHVQREDDHISIDSTHTKGQNMRLAGEDITLGQAVLKSRKLLSPADLGVISSLGIGEVKVIRKPKVAFFSTGDELRSIGDGRNKALSKGEIYDSNRYSLYGMLKQLNVDVIDLGVIEDNPDAIKKAFNEASSMADMVITSGGVSVGEADFIKPVLEEIGQIDFWKIAMKPGRPLTFGKINECFFFGLPGNPVSVMVTFYQFVQPALKYLSNAQVRLPINLRATCLAPFKKRSGRFEFQRGILHHAIDGSLTVDITGQQGSGILSSMSLANCFILFDEASTGVEAGDNVTVQPFDLLI